MNLDYEIFEEFADGSTLWHASVFGVKEAELKLRELSRRSANKFFALCVKDQTWAVIRPYSHPPNAQESRSAQES
jgi:hypothetical protein